MAKTTDELVMDLLVKVEQKKEEIKAAKKKPQWKTNCTIGYNPETTQDRINIQVVRDANKLIEIYAFLLEREEFFEHAAIDLGLPPDLTYMGYSIADWAEDLKSRAAQLSIETKQKEIEELDKRVNKLVSPEQRRAMELEALQQMLKD